MSSTVEEKRRVCRHLLLSSPPGQFDLVLADLLRVVGSDVLDEDVVGSFRTERDDRDHAHDDDDDESLLSVRWRAHAESTLHPVGSALRRRARRRDDGVVELTARSERVDLRDFRSGAWTSRYEYDEKSETLRGEVRATAHATENGHVRTAIKRTMAPRTGVAPEDVARLAAKFEEDVATSLRDRYRFVAETELRRTRRLLPVTRNKMDWSLVHAHRTTEHLKDTLRER